MNDALWDNEILAYYVADFFPDFILLHNLEFWAFGGPFQPTEHHS